MPGVYFGVVTIRNGEATHNAFFSGWFESEEEALGRGMKFARRERPRGVVTNAVAYPIDKELILTAAKKLA